MTIISSGSRCIQDVDAIAADCGDLAAQHGLDAKSTRQAIQAMLDEQPLPLRGGAPFLTLRR